MTSFEGNFIGFRRENYGVAVDIHSLFLFLAELNIYRLSSLANRVEDVHNWKKRAGFRSLLTMRSDKFLRLFL